MEVTQGQRKFRISGLTSQATGQLTLVYYYDIVTADDLCARFHSYIMIWYETSLTKLIAV